MQRNNNCTTCYVFKQVFNAVIAGLVLALAIKSISVMAELPFYTMPIMTLLFTLTGVFGSVSKGNYSVKAIVLSVGWGIAFGILVVQFGLELLAAVIIFAIATLTMVYYESYRTNETRD